MKPTLSNAISEIGEGVATGLSTKECLVADNDYIYNLFKAIESITYAIYLIPQDRDPSYHLNDAFSRLKKVKDSFDPP